MRLHHLALWSRRIELLRDFYTTYFDGHAGEKYENPAKGFESYFVTFADGRIVVDELQIAGKRRMSARDLLPGMRDLSDYSFGEEAAEA